MAESKTIKQTKKSEPVYSKSALLISKMFTPVEKDILRIELDENKTYSLTEVNKVITNFKGGI